MPDRALALPPLGGILVNGRPPTVYLAPAFAAWQEGIAGTGQTGVSKVPQVRLFQSPPSLAKRRCRAEAEIATRRQQARHSCLQTMNQKPTDARSYSW